MPVTVSHALSATTPDDPSYEIRPSHWNSAHNVTLSATAGTEIFGAFSNDPAFNVSFSTNAGGLVVASANVTAAPSPVNVTGANGSSVNAQTIAFSNSNGMTLGVSTAANGATVTGSYTVPTVTNSSWTVSDNATSATVGRLAFTQSNGLTMGLITSNNGNHTVTGSYTVPSVTDYFSKTNTTFNGANISGSLTLNTNGLQVSLSAAAGGAFSEGLSNLGNTSGNTGVTGTRVVWAGGNNITLSQATDANGATITVSGANAGGAQTGISGIVASDTTYTSGTVSFSNQNGVTIGSSVNGATQYVRLSVANQTNQSLGIYASSQTFGQSSSSTYDARSLSIYGSGGISVGWSNGSLGISGQTTAAQTNQTLGIYNSSQTTGASSSSTYDARSLTFAYSGNISGGWTNGSMLLNVTTAAQTNQTGGIYNSSQTTGASSSSTYDMRSITHVFSGNISGGWTNGSLLFNVTTAAQTNQTLGIYASSNTTGASSSSTYDARSLTIVGSDNISVGWTNGSLAIKGAAGGGVTPVASASNGSFSFTTIAFSNANNVTFGTSAGSIITASVAAPGAAAENNWVNLLGANTAGNTTASGSTIGYSGINLTLSGTNGSVVNISAPATSSLVGSSGISISTNGSTITVGQILGSYYDNFNGLWPNSTTMQPAQSTSHIQPFILPEPISFAYIRIPMSLSVLASSTGVTTGNSTFSYGITRSHNFAIYSRGIGASSQSLQSIYTTQFTDQQSINVAAAANSTQFSYTNRASYQMSTGVQGYTFDYSSSAASLNFHTSNMTAITGLKMMEFAVGTSLTPGVYWLMYGVSTNSASQYTAQGSRLFNNISQYGASMPNLQFGSIGDATQNSVGPFLGHGSFSTAGGGSTASLPISAVTTTSAHNKMKFELVRIA